MTAPSKPQATQDQQALVWHWLWVTRGTSVLTAAALSLLAGTALACVTRSPLNPAPAALLTLGVLLLAADNTLLMRRRRQMLGHTFGAWAAFSDASQPGASARVAAIVLIAQAKAQTSMQAWGGSLGVGAVLAHAAAETFHESDGRGCQSGHTALCMHRRAVGEWAAWIDTASARHVLGGAPEKTPGGSR